MPRVFISHSSHDRNIVERDIIAPLHNHGIKTWYSRDAIQTAGEWKRKITEGLERCEWFVVVLSSHSVKSKWVEIEVEWALTNREGKVIPILIEDCDPRALDPRLPSIHYEDFRENPEDAQKRVIITVSTGRKPSEAPPKKSRRPLLIGGGLIALLLIVITGLVFIASGGKKPTAPANDDNSAANPGKTPANDAAVVPAGPTGAQKLVNDIQVSKLKAASLDSFLSYAAAHGIKHSLRKHLNVDPADMNAEQLAGLEVEADMLGSHAVISVSSYRQFGYIMFLDARNNALVLEDDNFESDIQNIQFMNFGEKALPNAIVEVQYTTVRGTGIYGSSVKIYTLTGEQVRLSLDKPYFERNSGWGAFPEEEVEFKTRNIYDINPRTSLCEIRTIGSAVAISFDENDEPKAIKRVDGGNVIAYHPLKDEFYVWNPRSGQFVRKNGRDMAGQGYMTSAYEDYAKKPAGEWLHKPVPVKEGRSLLDLLYDESQTGDTEQDE